MDVHTVTVIEGAIEYIETHLDQRIDLESVASAPDVYGHGWDDDP